MKLQSIGVAAEILKVMVVKEFPSVGGMDDLRLAAIMEGLRVVICEAFGAAMKVLAEKDNATAVEVGAMMEVKVVVVIAVVKQAEEVLNMNLKVL